MRKGKPDWWEDAVSHLVEDPHIGGLVDRFRKESLQGKGDIFQTLVRSIVGQQISVIAADSVHARLEGLCGVITRESIATKTLEELTSCGLSKPKSEYILGIATSSGCLRGFGGRRVNQTSREFQGHRAVDCGDDADILIDATGRPQPR